VSRRPTITVVLDGYSSLVRGYGSRDMVQAVTGRPPTYSSVRKGWSCQEDTARDVIAVAEARNCDIVITGGRSPRPEPDQRPPHQPEQPDPGRGLW
jgi:hypothetical protein